MIHIGAARDEELASAYRGGGAFTIALCETLARDFRGGYRDLVRTVSAALPDQHPRLNFYGPGAEEFARQKPFRIGEEIPARSAKDKAKQSPDARDMRKKR
ncbi:MAG: hypothetical protein ACYDH3_07530 [Candidatus Aminicenantales bacterium]